ncbi:MAG: Ig-like domain-containing protein, partial [Campylobacterota bacterium]|nr:Ig-like domain-containing protein [Campylobacterota bacterium]
MRILKKLFVLLFLNISLYAGVPSVEISDDIGDATTNSDVTFTFTWSEAVTGFNTDDVAITGGTKGTFTATSATEYTLVVTPTANTNAGTITADIAASAATSESTTEDNTATANATQDFDTLAPTVTITDNQADILTDTNDNTLYTFEFSEDITGFSTDDVTVTNGTKGTFTATDANTYTLEVTADDDSVLNISVELGTTDVADAVGNAFAGDTENTQTVDTTNPTVASIVLDDTALKIGDTATVTITFSEAVQSFENTDLTIENGTLTEVSTTDDIIYTATFTPTVDIEDTTNTITVNTSDITDNNGNTLSANGVSANFEIDTLAPTANTLTLTDTELIKGETTTLTVEFSQVVQNLDTTDFSVENGTLTNLATNDNITFTATFTPSVDTQDDTNTITLNISNITDTNDNALSGTLVSANYTVDTLAPTITANSISSNNANDTALAKVGDTITLAFTSSETLSANPTVTIDGNNATVTNTAGDNYTATYDMSVGDTTGAISFTIDFSDSVGNAGVQVTSATDTSSVIFDETAPSVTSIVLDDTALKIGDDTNLTIVFSESVLNFENSDINLSDTNGTLSAISSSDGNITFIATFTPTDGFEDTTNTIKVSISNITDKAGNPLADINSSANFEIDTKISTPAIPNLADASDSFGQNGTNDDNLTNDTTPLIDGNNSYGENLKF